MSLKDRTTPLTTPAQVDEFLLRNAACALFKAGTCHKTGATFQHVEAQLDGRPDLPLGVIEVVAARAASDHVAKLTGIRHESPQIILFRNGQALFERDNWDITSEAIASALSQHFAVSPA